MRGSRIQIESKKHSQMHTIVSLLNQIKNGEIVLPAIQRDFVWPENDILKLLDSIMRGYPIGLVLLWETYNDIQYRTFSKDFIKGVLNAYDENGQAKRLKVVLDGQQRLQSLYIALYGTINGKALYFDVLSGTESNDSGRDKFVFKLMDDKEARETNPSDGDFSNDSDQFSLTLPPDVQPGDVIDVTYSKQQTKARGLKHSAVEWGTFSGVLVQIFGNPPARIRARFSYEDAPSEAIMIDLARGLDIDYNVAISGIGRSQVSRSTLDKWDQKNKPDELETEDQSTASHFARIADLFNKRPLERQALRKQLAEKLGLSDNDEARLDFNLAQLNHAFSVDPNILQVSVIDEGLPPEPTARKSETDVLEIFVRVNSKGMDLSHSDLIFSMLKLNWRQSAKDLPEFVAKVNLGNEFELDADFVIRCLLAVSGLGTKFDVNLIRKKNNVAALRDNFERCCDAIKSTVDFVQNDCWCSSSRILGGKETLVPFVYYLFHTKMHQVKNENIVDVRRALYLFAFARPFSRYADSRLWAFIKNEIKPRTDVGDESFPYARAVRRVAAWEGIDGLERLLQNNKLLTLYVVQNLSGSKAQYPPNAAEIDHIFPKSELFKRGLYEEDVDHFANFWILRKVKNQIKSDHDPREYFDKVPAEELERALIDKNMLGYDQFPAFLKTRSANILDRIRKKLSFSDSDFDTNQKGAVGSTTQAKFFQPKVGECVAVIYEDAEPEIYIGVPFPGTVIKSGNGEFWVDFAYESLEKPGEIKHENNTHIAWHRKRAYWCETQYETRVAVLKATNEQIAWCNKHGEQAKDAAIK